MTSMQVCGTCGAERGLLEPGVECPCGGLLDLRHDPPIEDGRSLQRLFAGRRNSRAIADQSGVWRFRELVLPGVEHLVVSHPEGNTPLLEREVVTQWAGLDHLQLKHEGHNPTGSFKDRGMTVGVTQAKRLAATALACASTGNTSASLAAYGAQAGLPVLVVVPAGKVALGKLGQSLAYGARTVQVRGDFDACLRLVREASARLGIYLLNSVNPFRIQGQKTIMFELLEQLNWEAPDWVVVPAGNLGNTAAFGMALVEAHRLGLTDRVPRLAAVQAEGASPFAAGFAEGFTRRRRVTAETVATAIRIGDPASWDRAVRSIRDTGGVVATVSDAEILEAKAVIDGSGVGCEPASAASVAGARSLRRVGVIGAGDRVVAVLTGHILKDPEILLRDVGGPSDAESSRNAPAEIEPTVGELERVLRRR
ncbi:MAG: threonine synthase [Gemmatimonadales bacterium]|nr:MAG: threonine synthase [Gemmatimonadales bacterium]